MVFMWTTSPETDLSTDEVLSADAGLKTHLFCTDCVSAVRTTINIIVYENALI